MTNRLRAWLCGSALFALVFSLGSLTNNWRMPANKWIFDKGGESHNLWAWLASLPKSSRWDRRPHQPDNNRSCAILLGASVGLGAIGFWFARGRQRDELMRDYRDGLLGPEKDGRLQPENSALDTTK
jgi:hypothetical protein